MSALRHGKDVPAIDPDEAETFPVPRLDARIEATIARHIWRAHRLVDEANCRQDEAQALLAESLG